MKLKELHFADVAEIQEAVTNEIKKVQKRNFQQIFRNCTTAQNPVCMPMELILNKKVCVFLVCLRFKKFSLKTFGPHCVYLDELKIYKTIYQKLVKVYRCETLSNHVKSIYFLNLDRNNGITNKSLSEEIFRLAVSRNSLLFRVIKKMGAHDYTCTINSLAPPSFFFIFFPASVFLNNFVPATHFVCSFLFRRTM
jgi:hypothetical protein